LTGESTDQNDEREGQLPATEGIVPPLVGRLDTLRNAVSDTVVTTVSTIEQNRADMTDSVLDRVDSVRKTLSAGIPSISREELPTRIPSLGLIIRKSSSDGESAPAVEAVVNEEIVASGAVPPSMEGSSNPVQERPGLLPGIPSLPKIPIVPTLPVPDLAESKDRLLGRFSPFGKSRSKSDD